MSNYRNIAECEANKTGGFWMRLVQVHNGNEFHVLADWSKVATKTEAKRYAMTNDAELQFVQPVNL